MSLKKHFIRVFFDFTLIFGLIMLVLIGYTIMISNSSISLFNLIQLLYLVGFLVLRMESMVNFHQLEDHHMRINYWITSLLSDISFILLLSTLIRSEFYISNGWMLVVLYFGLKILFYLLMHVQSIQLARKINDKLKLNQ